MYRTIANAINDSGIVVGFAKQTESSPAKAAVWRPPNYRLEVLPDLVENGQSAALAIGSDGTVGGTACDGQDSVSPCHPVYWRAGILHRLDGIGNVNAICPCDSHSMVGRVRVNGADHAALWVDDILIDVGMPPGFTGGEFRSISRGNIVGNGFDGFYNFSGAIAAFRWSPSAGWVPLQSTIETVVLDVNKSGTAVGAFNEIWYAGSNLESPLPVNSFPSAINDSGVVAGLFDPTFGAGNPDNYTPGTWTAATGWIALGHQVKPTVTDINNAGLVVGYWRNQDHVFATIWQP